ncbi:MAG: hypothetical protein MZV64_31470 [Ignavibacteriales bacterium]|nr:hypothetical protein [Ignavibacteriales bacterium]
MSKTLTPASPLAPARDGVHLITRNFPVCTSPLSLSFTLNRYRPVAIA